MACSDVRVTYDHVNIITADRKKFHVVLLACSGLAYLALDKHDRFAALGRDKRRGEGGGTREGTERIVPSRAWILPDGGEGC